MKIKRSIIIIIVLVSGTYSLRSEELIMNIANKFDIEYYYADYLSACNAYFQQSQFNRSKTETSLTITLKDTFEKRLCNEGMLEIVKGCLSLSNYQKIKNNHSLKAIVSFGVVMNKERDYQYLSCYYKYG